MFHRHRSPIRPQLPGLIAQRGRHVSLAELIVSAGEFPEAVDLRLSGRALRLQFQDAQRQVGEPAVLVKMAAGLVIPADPLQNLREFVVGRLVPRLPAEQSPQVAFGRLVVPPVQGQRSPQLERHRIGRRRLQDVVDRPPGGIEVPFQSQQLRLPDAVGH